MKKGHLQAAGASEQQGHWSQSEPGASAALGQSETGRAPEKSENPLKGLTLSRISFKNL